MEYKGRGFWSYDPYLEHLRALLTEAIGDTPSDPWLAQASEHWALQASGIFSGWIHPKFDEYISNQERRITVRSLIATQRDRPDATREVDDTAELLDRYMPDDMSALSTA
jgi:hypothetical protein